MNANEDQQKLKEKGDFRKAYFFIGIFLGKAYFCSVNNT